ncbi:MAG: polysaccharide biosynthesis/export family protein [Bryobacteraceae bacterium]
MVRYCLFAATAFSVGAQTVPGFAERDPDYKLRPSDSVEVQYRYTPEFNATVTVQPDGFVTLPMTGSVRVGGMSARQASAAIAAKAGERLKDPEVSVILKDFVKPYFTVAGEVTKPGRYDLRGEATVLEGIAQSGWFNKESAKHSQVLLVRRVGDDLGEVRVVNLKKTATARYVQEDLKLRAGDLLVVPQNFISKLDRYFRWSSLSNLGFLLK